MKILLLTSRMDIGGAESHILTLAKELKRLGSTVICASCGGRCAEMLKEHGIAHITLPLDSKKPSCLIRSYKGILYIIKNQKPDIVHSHSRIPSVLVGKIHKKYGGFSFCTTVHAPYSASPLKKRLSLWGEHCIAVSDDLKSYIENTYKIKSENVTVIENGVTAPKMLTEADRAATIAELCIPRDATVISSSSRTSKSRAKTLEYLSKNAPALLAPNEVLLLIISGKCDLEKDMTERIKKYAKESNRTLGREAIVIVEGKENIEKYLAISDVFIGVSRSAIEAASYKNAVILSGNEGYSGILTKDTISTELISNLTCRDSTADISELSKDLEKLRSKTKRAECAADSYQIYKEHFTSEQMTAKTLGVYEKLQKSKGRGRLLILGHFGASNVGDDAIAMAMTQAFCEYDLIFVSKKVKKIKSIIKGAKGISRLNLFSIFSAAKKCDAVILGAGNLIQDETSLRSLLYYGFMFFACSSLAARSVIFSSGIGPLYRKISKKIAAAIISRADYVSTRERASASEAAALSRRGDIRLFSDICYTLKKQKTLPSETYNVVIPRHDQGKDCTEALSKFISENTALGVKTKILCMSEQDTKAAKKLYAMTEDTELIPYSDVDLALKVIGGAVLTVSARLHGVIFSLLEETDVVGIDTDGRIKEQISYSGYGVSVDASRISADELICAADKAKMTLKDPSVSEKMRRLAYSDIEELINFLRT